MSDPAYRCVKCGKFLDEYDSEASINNGNPPACLDHVVEVYEESEKGHSMWPSDWYGHWLLPDPFGEPTWKFIDGD